MLAVSSDNRSLASASVVSVGKWQWHPFKSTDPEICHPYFLPVLQVLHLHPAGVPEDAHGRRQADGTRAGPHMSDAPHTVRHEVSQNLVKIIQKIPLDLL